MEGENITMNHKVHFSKKDITATITLCGVLCVVAITIKLLLPTPQYDAYCDQMLEETGLVRLDMPFSVVHRHCEEEWIDTQVYFELKVKGNDMSEVINRLRSFPQYEGEIAPCSQLPAWWRPGTTATKITYYNTGSRSPVVIAYVEPPVNGYFIIYIHVIPV